MNQNRKLEVCPEKIINAIKARPALYKKSDPKYNTMNRFKGKIWKEVCKEVFKDWDQMKPQQRREYGIELQKRWKSLRSCFARELAVQKKEQEDGSFVRLRKRYAYFDQMSFLLQPDSVKASDSSCNDTALEDTDDESDNDHLQVEEKDIVVKREGLEIEVDYEPEETTNNVGTVSDVMKRNEVDEDTQFLLSLVPSMRKLNAKQKFTAKIGILNVIKDVTFQE